MPSDRVVAVAPRRPVEERPEGLVYRSELLTADEEQALLEEIEPLDFQEIRMHGVVAKRTARHFGLDYDYDQRGVTTDVDPIPDWLLGVREAAAGLADVAADEFVEALVQRYPEGSSIGWHRDAPMFGTVAGVSLASPARMRFRRDVGGERRTFELELEPRSGYVLAGPARTAWQHHVPPTKALRYSITFRTLRNPERWLGSEAVNRKRAERLGERERALGLDPDDEAARWLREHDPEPKPETPKSARKSKALHRWRQRKASS
jgi:alkylated DNA repair protein (DNA oxidative demethylase)